MKDGEIKNKLSPAQVSVMMHRVTEPPYFGKYWDTFSDGTYACAACETALFSSVEKFDSKTGWPSFKKPINERDLQFKSEPGPDDKVEVRCKKCKSHLGYVIPGESPYYRINSVCMIFRPVIAEGLAAAQNEPAKKPTPVIERTPAADTESPSTVLSGIVGALIGFVIGASGAAWYFKQPTPVIPETATSTPETATTTPEENIVPEPIVEEPNTPVETAPETPGTTPENASSTQ